MSLLVKAFRGVSRTSVMPRFIARRSLSDAISERERAAEAAYFNQEDARALAELRSKLRLSKTSQTDNAAVNQVEDSEIDELREIIAPHSLPSEVLQRK